MKVYGGWLIRGRKWPDTGDDPHHTQVRAVMAAPSRAALRRGLAAHGVDVSDAFLRDYWGETGNDDDIAAALAEPGSLWIRSMHRWKEPSQRVPPVDVTPP